MGFWRKLFGIESKESPVRLALEDGKNKMDFVDYDEESDFEKSIFGKLEIISAGIPSIRIVLPKEADSLEEQINLLRTYLEKSNSEDDSDVQKVFEELNKEYIRVSIEADGLYTIKALEIENRTMDKMFLHTPGSTDGISSEKLEDLIDRIRLIQEKVNNSDFSDKPLLSGVLRQKFNSISLYSEYRIKMLELMLLCTYYGYSDIKNPFEKLSKSKQIIFSKYFLDDAHAAAERYGKVCKSESAIKENGELRLQVKFNSLDNVAGMLDTYMENAAFVDDFSISQLFDSRNSRIESFEFLKKFINFQLDLNMFVEAIPGILKDKELKEREKRELEEKQRAEEEEERKLLERCGNMSDAEMEQEIRRIEQNGIGTGNRYIQILDFQKKVARIKGLLPDDSLTGGKEEFAFATMDFQDVFQVIQNAKRTGSLIYIFPDGQEHSNGRYTVITSKKNEVILDTKCDVNFQENNDVSNVRKFGHYPDFILNMIRRKMPEYLCSGNNLLVCRDDNDDRRLLVYNRGGEGYDIYRKREVEILNVLEDVKKELSQIDTNTKDTKDTKDIFCYISLPTTSSILSLLEKFKELGIRPFMEPVPINSNSRNEADRDTIHIYFERDNLEKFRSGINLAEVNPKASLHFQNVQFSKLILDTIEWPKCMRDNEKRLNEI